ncbi:hypothetical protein CRG98_032820 [Punica granatum]|uniref:Uncharacterized protein n=1 Tax=Punica granatum TaxID=22663 RepID=A0A2I0ISV1_PUNGR|nr:hypothetical protein CRG98_032820 [Punica granatum]
MKSSLKDKIRGLIGHEGPLRPMSDPTHTFRVIAFDSWQIHREEAHGVVVRGGDAKGRPRFKSPVPASGQEHKKGEKSRWARCPEIQFFSFNLLRDYPSIQARNIKELFLDNPL